MESRRTWPLRTNAKILRNNIQIIIQKIDKKYADWDGNRRLMIIFDINNNNICNKRRIPWISVRGIINQVLHQYKLTHELRGVSSSSVSIDRALQKVVSRYDHILNQPGLLVVDMSSALQVGDGPVDMDIYREIDKSVAKWK